MGYGKDESSNYSESIIGVGTQNITITNQDKQNNRYNKMDPQSLYTAITTDDITQNNHIMA